MVGLRYISMLVVIVNGQALSVSGMHMALHLSLARTSFHQVDHLISGSISPSIYSFYCLLCVESELMRVYYDRLHLADRVVCYIAMHWCPATFWN